jgi:hypothetical protein
VFLHVVVVVKQIPAQDAMLCRGIHVRIIFVKTILCGGIYFRIVLVMNIF